MNWKTGPWAMGLLLIAVCLAACGEDPTGLEPVPTRTPGPSATPTPWQPSPTPPPPPPPTATRTPGPSATPTPWQPSPTPPLATATPTPGGDPTWPPGADGTWQGTTSTGGAMSFRIQNQNVVNLTLQVIVPCSEGGSCAFIDQAYIFQRTGPASFSAEDIGRSWRIDGVVLSETQCAGVWSAPIPVGYCSVFTGWTCGGSGSWSASKAP